MAISERDIQRVVQQVVDEVAGAGSGTAAVTGVNAGDGVFADMEEALRAAQAAHPKLLNLGLEKRKELIAAMRQAALDHAEMLGRMAVEETGLGKMPDKMQKVLLAARKTPGVEDVQPVTFTGDAGLTLEEPAPFGVVGVITPSTNPPSTIINNTIGLVAAGNTCVINPHPGAKAVSAKTVQLLHRAIVKAGGPAGVINCIGEPTQDTAVDLMKHPAVRLMLVTGGGAVVKLAMTSGKRCICGGPGNPPVVVDESADIPKAAKDIIDGANFDNNVLCIGEKEVFVVTTVADQLMREMEKHGAQKLNAAQAANLTRKMVKHDPTGKGYRHVSTEREFVGKPVAVLGQAIGLQPKAGTRHFIFEAKWDHPLVMAEQLTTVLPIVRVKGIDEAMALAVQVEHNYGHTFMMHSRNVANLSKMAQLCNASIFVKNGPSYAGLGFGGEGHTTLTIASPTGEGLTRARHFSRPRRCVLVDYFRIV